MQPVQRSLVSTPVTAQAPPLIFATPTPEEWHEFTAPLEPAVSFINRFSCLRPFRVFVQGSYCWSLGKDWFTRSAETQKWTLSEEEKNQLTLFPYQDIDLRIEFELLTEALLNCIESCIPPDMVKSKYYRTPPGAPYPYLIIGFDQFDFIFIGKAPYRALATAEDLFIPLDGEAIEGNPTALRAYFSKIRSPYAYTALEWKKSLVSICRGWHLEEGNCLNAFTISSDETVPLLMQAAAAHKISLPLLLQQACFLFPHLTDWGPLVDDPLYRQAIKLCFPLATLNALMGLKHAAAAQPTERWGSWIMVRTEQGLAIRVDWSLIDTICMLPEEFLPYLSFAPLARTSLWNHVPFQNFLLRALLGSSLSLRSAGCQLLSLDPQASINEWISSLKSIHPPFADLMQRRLIPDWLPPDFPLDTARLIATADPVSFLIRGLRSTSLTFRTITCQLLRLDPKLSNKQLIIPLAASSHPQAGVVVEFLRQEAWRDLSILQRAQLVCLLIEKNGDYAPLFLKLTSLRGIKSQSAHRLFQALIPYLNLHLVEHALKLELFLLVKWPRAAVECYLRFLPQAILSSNFLKQWKSNFSHDTPFETVVVPFIRALFPEHLLVAYELLKDPRPASILWRRLCLDWIEAVDQKKHARQVQHLLEALDDIPALKRWQIVCRFFLSDLPLSSASRKLLDEECPLEGDLLLGFIYKKRPRMVSQEVKERVATAITTSLLRKEEVDFWSSWFEHHQHTPPQLSLYLAEFYLKTDYRQMRHWFCKNRTFYSPKESLPYVKRMAETEDIGCLFPLSAACYEDSDWRLWLPSLFHNPSPAPWLIEVAYQLKVFDEPVLRRLALDESSKATPDQLEFLLFLVSHSAFLSLRVHVFLIAAKIQKLDDFSVLYFFNHIAPFLTNDTPEAAQIWDTVFEKLNLDELFNYYLERFLPCSSSFILSRARKIIECMTRFKLDDNTITCVLSPIPPHLFANPFQTEEEWYFQVHITRLLFCAQSPLLLNLIPSLLNRLTGFPVAEAVKRESKQSLESRENLVVNYEEMRSEDVAIFHRAIISAGEKDAALIPLLRLFFQKTSVETKAAFISSSIAHVHSMQVRLLFLQEITSYPDHLSNQCVRNMLVSLLYQYDLYQKTPAIKNNMNSLFQVLISREDVQVFVYEIFEHPKAREAISQFNELMSEFWISSLRKELRTSTVNLEKQLGILQRALLFFTKLSPSRYSRFLHEFQEVAYPYIEALSKKHDSLEKLITDDASFLFYSLIGPACHIFALTRTDPRYGQFITDTLTRLKRGSYTEKRIRNAIYWISNFLIGTSKITAGNSAEKTLLNRLSNMVADLESSTVQ